MTLTLQTVSCIVQKPSRMTVPTEKELSSSDTPPPDPIKKENIEEAEERSAFSSPSSSSLKDPIQQTHANYYVPEAHNILTLSQFPTFQQHSILNLNFLKSSKENYIKPIFDSQNQQVILPVECGQNHAFMYLNRLCQGSKGSCILFKNTYWLTPNEFQFVSGRETAKDWKRSIRHNGKSIKLLINKGILGVHSPLCECGTTITNSSLKMGMYPTRSPGHQKDGDMKYELDPEMVDKQRPDTTFSSGLRNGATWDNITTDHHCRNKLVGEDRIFSLNSWEGLSSLNHSDPESSKFGETQYDERISASSSGSGCSVSISPLTSNSSTCTAIESQSEENSVTGSMNNNNNNDSPNPPKSKRKSKGMTMKSERQSPPLGSSTTSPPMTPPPINNPPSSAQKSSSPSPQPKHLDPMMGSCRNYSDFMRSLAAKYNNNQPNVNSDYYARSAANFGFDTRFLKPTAAAALLNLGGTQFPPALFGLDKDKFPLMDMSSTQALLSIVRSASGAAAANLEASKSTQSHKRPSSPLDLSSREVSNTSPQNKKPKSKNPMLDFTANMKGTVSPCSSSCSSSCTEEAQIISKWSVDDVVRFVSSIEECKGYEEAFRSHEIDGKILAMCNANILCNCLGMKLGPALKFQQIISGKLGTCALCSHCTHCHNHNNNEPAINP